MIGTELLRYRDTQLYMGADKETTSLNLHFALPWQVCFSLFTNKEDIATHSYMIKWPGLVVSQEAAVITRFDKRKYDAEGCDPKEILDIFESYLYNKDYRIVMQNGLAYDIYIHSNWRRQLGLKPNFDYLERFIDTIALTKAIKKSWTPPSNPDEFISWQYKAVGYFEKGLKSNLTTVGKEYKIEHDYTALHDATADVDLMKKIFRKQIWQIEI